MKRSSASVKPILARVPSLIAVIHLPPLAGAPGSATLSAPETLQIAGQRAVQEARLLEKAGFEAIILENFGDIPFYREEVPPETIASLAVIAAAVHEAVRVPIGINVLRNDARAALAIAAVTGCDFIRVNVLSGVAATDQGIIEGRAAELLRERARFGAEHVAILADAHVKHARPLSGDDLELAVEEARLRAGADGVIVTGATTGRPIEGGDLQRAALAARACGAPLYLGSGATIETIAALKPYLYGVIVSSALRRGGVAGAPLDVARARAFVRAWRAAPAKPKAKGGAKARTQSKAKKSKK